MSSSSNTLTTYVRDDVVTATDGEISLCECEVSHSQSKPLLYMFSGSVQVRYNLGGLKEPFTIDVDQRNLANGQPHSINMSRVNRSITIQVQTTHT